MHRRVLRIGLPTILAALLLCGTIVETRAAIDGITGADVGGGVVEFNLTARCDFVSTPDGNSLLIWGYSDDDAPMDAPWYQRAQYPGPTLIVDQGATVRINLTNTITDEEGALIGVNTSMLFPGQQVSSTGGVSGLLAKEAEPGAAVTYTFPATEPGTYMYHSGTRTELQVELGLLGALIIRPSGAGFDAPRQLDGDGLVLTPGHAYNTEDSAFDREYLMIFTEMDPDFHDLVEFDLMDQIDNTDYLPVYWFLNGRNAPDTLAGSAVPWLPTQPYNILPMMHPGERTLVRMIGASRDMHPMHLHGNNGDRIARNGRLLQSPGGTGADLKVSENTFPVIPGETQDIIWTWTGKQLNWDVYGDPDDPDFAHTCSNPACPDTAPADGFDDTTPSVACEDAVTFEYCPDHGKPFPAIIPESQDLTFGGFYSGSPFLGHAGDLPPGEGGLNPWDAYVLIWHVHAEKEIVNFDVFPGGTITFMYVVPPLTPGLP